MKRMDSVILLVLFLFLFGCAAATDSSDEGDDLPMPGSVTGPPSSSDDDNDDDDDSAMSDDDDDNDTSGGPDVPTIIWRDCVLFFPAPWHHLIPNDLACGTVEAPVDWEESEDTERLEVRFAVAPATGDSPRGVLAVNLGGPDANLRNALLFSLRPDGLVPAGLTADYHILFVETRGSFMSSTPLVCPETLDGRYFADLERYRSYVQQCLNAQQSGVSPALMSTVDAARDLNFVRRALGVEKMRLFGNSYGSRLMLEYLRLFPESVSAYVLDSTLPPQSTGRHFLDENLDQLAAACDASDRCPFADGQALIEETEWLLNEAGGDEDFGWALTQDLFHLGDRPAVLAAWVGSLAGALAGDWSLVRQWHDAAKGLRAEPSELDTDEDRFYWDPYADNVMCIDFPGWNDFAGREFVLRRLHPPYVSTEQIEAMTHIACQELAASYTREPTVDRTPVTATMPGLLIAPRFDQATPSGNAFKAVAEGLVGAAVVPVNADHALLIDLGADWLGLPDEDQRCLRELVADWLSDPFDPFDRACVRRLAAPVEVDL
ncbi:MAG: alpha/beta hydrolase [Candidatus Lernaella stagnicola]|nr:alpha/beta hydrolase [Candidatus Lernaella stagnicola]